MTWRPSRTMVFSEKNKPSNGEGLGFRSFFVVEMRSDKGLTAGFTLENMHS